MPSTAETSTSLPQTPRAAMTAPAIAARKGGARLAMLTAYDYPTARLAEEAGADMLLVGDSLGMVVLGLPDTLSVTLEMMIHHCAAVSRAASRALVVGDLPFMTYEAGPDQALASAGRLMQEGGARAVKMEGGRELVPTVQALTRAGVPVMGHVGLTPQRVAALGGFKVQGKTPEAGEAILEDAKALAEAGCFAVVVEAVPASLGHTVTSAVAVPTIGIGAGPHCDGQVLVWHDVVGLFERFKPKFVKRYAELAPLAREALAAFCNEVAEGRFPGPEHSFGGATPGDDAP